jgi:hypothetical protein
MACCLTADDGAAELVAGMVDSTMESNMFTPMASSKPLTLAELDPVERRKMLTTDDVRVSVMTDDGILAVIGDAERALISDAESLSIGDAESMMIGDAE